MGWRVTHSSIYLFLFITVLFVSVDTLLSGTFCESHLQFPL